MSVEAARDLLRGFLDGQVTHREAARRADVWTNTARPDASDDWPDGVLEALVELFPLGPSDAPDPRSVRVALAALDLSPRPACIVLGVATRLVLLSALLSAADVERVPNAVLRPGERVLLGTAGGRRALSRLLDGEVEPMAAWLERTVLDPAAFQATTWDVPLMDVDGLAALVRLLVRDTELLPAGPARAMVASEWVTELATDSLPDQSTFPEVVRAIGELLLESEAPILLWHAVQELAVVLEDDPELAERVLERCLPVSASEHGRCPATAAAPLLGELGVDDAADLLERISPRLDPESWAAVETYLGRVLALQWLEWRPHVRRWAEASDRTRAAAVRRAIERAGTPEREALAWFRH